MTRKYAQIAPDPRPEIEPVAAWSRLVRTVPLAIVLAIAVAYAVTAPDAAVDTWISLASGRHVIAHGVNDTDPFSFASRLPAAATLAPDASSWQRLWAWLYPIGWINQNWASHVILFWLHELGGLTALVIAKALIYLGVAVLLVLNARRRGAAPEIAVALAALALVACREFTQVRAQAFTDLAAAALFLLLTHATRRDSRTFWLVVPLFAAWGNLHGGFVYGFVMLAVMVVAYAVAGRRPRGLLELAPAAMRALLAASAAAVAVTVLASPYRLANLVHPLVISVGPDAAEWRKVNEWKPLLSGGTRLDIAIFVVLVAATAVAAWSAARKARQGTARATATAGFDLAAVLMVAVTEAMAMQSVRFLPLACIAAAPVVAGCIGEALVPRKAAKAKRGNGGLHALWLWLAAAIASAAFLLPFLRSSSGPWPGDAQRTGVADRLLESWKRPWDACSFLAANALSGKMWNFWEEGGFLAWCQTPDPVSGRPPLRVLIDGRAQTAFDAAASRDYDLFMSGGPAGTEAVARGLELTPAQGRAGMAWVERRMRELGTWIAHVPVESEETFAGLALLNLPTWRIVYADARHTILVDEGTAEGAAAAARARAGALVYPDPAWADLTAAFALLHSPDDASLRSAVALARRSWERRPSWRAVVVATSAARSPGAAAAAAAFARAVGERFLADRERIVATSGSGDVAEGARLAFEHVLETSRRRGDAAGVRWAEQGLTVAAEAQAELDRQSAW